MTRFLIRRILWSIPLILGIVTVLFFVVQLAPGGPEQGLIGPHMTAEVRSQVRTNFGLDEALPVRYLRWVGAAARGNFGDSFTHRRPALDVIRRALPNTLLLSGSALVISFLAAIVIGSIQAIRQHSLFDSAMSVVMLFFYSMPSFWIALMMVLTLSYFARNVWDWPLWFPAAGMQSSDYELLPFAQRLLDRIHHMVLPVLSLSLALTAGIGRYMRSSMLDVIRQDFVRTAHAKGLSERAVVFKHALRNSLLPIVTQLGLFVPILFGGTIFIEYVFAWPGMGRAIFEAVLQRDYPLIMAASFMFSAMVVAGNIIADLLYALIDPRIRHE